MKRAVITILGTITCYNLKTGEYDKTRRAFYEVEGKLRDVIKLKHSNYTNMFPIIIENFKDNYEIVPIYTDFSKQRQIEVLLKCEDDHLHLSEKYIEEMFKRGIYIEDENNFKEILKEIDKKIREYDEVIIDVSHGFRHLPILMTIDLIVTSLKNESKDKIKYILFAEEIVKDKHYKIVDLSEYLELANLAFIINIFKDNYSVSNHIKVKSPEYKEIVELMQKFSKDLMGLSIDNLLDEKDGISTKLIEKLKELEGKDIILFKDEIQTIRGKLERVYTKKEHRYQTFYYIAEDVASEERGYLAVAISLIFEGVSFYLYTSLKKSSSKLESFFDSLEEKAEKEKDFTFYDILDLCRGVFGFSKNVFKVSKKLQSDVTDEIKDELFKAKNRILKLFGFYKPITKHPLIALINDTKNLRNNLLHANSGDKVEDVNDEVKKLLKRYKKLLINKGDKNGTSNNN
jgi:CRISPR-associated DxTHG motif protein